MSGPVRLDQEIWSGDDTPPLVWGFGDIGASEIPVGAEFRLEISWNHVRRVPGSGPDLVGSITAASPNSGLAVDQTAGTVTWSYTTSQSAGIPRGAADYVLRCIYGNKTQTWAYGLIYVDGAGS